MQGITNAYFALLNITNMYSYLTTLDDELFSTHIIQNQVNEVHRLIQKQYAHTFVVNDPNSTLNSN